MCRIPSTIFPGITTESVMPNRLNTPSEQCAGNRIMIGGTTELNNGVPLENFLAMREAVLENPY